MRQTSGTTSLPISTALQEMLSLSWLRRACAVIRKVVPLLGSSLVSSKVSIQASFRATAMQSECYYFRTLAVADLAFSSNVDALFKKHTYLMFPSKTIHTDGIRAGIMVCTRFFMEINILTHQTVVIRFRSSRWCLSSAASSLSSRRLGAFRL
jgi:hypothetical protein